MIEFWKSARSNIERIIFSLALLFLPTQFGRHFWPSFAYVHGVRVDYLSPTIYTTDVLIVFLFILHFSHELHFKNFINKKLSPPFLFALLFLLMTILFSQVPILGILYLCKLAELLFFGWYSATVFRTQKSAIFFLFSAGILFESLLTIAQYFNQGSLGGVFYFLGERLYSGTTPGVANASMSGQLTLRPYGTFSHPNVLAGYLVIAMTLLLGLWNHLPRRKNVLLFAIFFFGTIALFLTLSRVAILLWVLLLFFLFLKQLYPVVVKKRLFIVSFLVTGFFVLLSSMMLPFVLPRFFETSLSDESVTLRLSLAKDAITMIFTHPFLGVGPHNFLVALPSYEQNARTVFTLQPVHNIFLLIGAETGYIGLVISLLFVISLCSRLWKKYKVSYVSEKQFLLFLSITLSEIIVLGMFDHYFLTIQQGQLLSTMVIGFITAY